MAGTRGWFSVRSICDDKTGWDTDCGTPGQIAAGSPYIESLFSLARLGVPTSNLRPNDAVDDVAFARRA